MDDYFALAATPSSNTVQSSKQTIEQHANDMLLLMIMIPALLLTLIAWGFVISRISASNARSAGSRSRRGRSRVVVMVLDNHGVGDLELGELRTPPLPYVAYDSCPTYEACCPAYEACPAYEP